MRQFIHEPYYNSNGKEIPSVTTVIKLLNNKELLDWANFMGLVCRKKHTEVSEKAALIGTLTHHYLERIGKNKIISYKLLKDYKKDISDSVMRGIKEFNQWKKEYEPEIVHCEMKVKNERVGGTIDNISIINNELFIIDYKTSKNLYPTMFLQLAAYNKLLREEKDMKIDMVGILLLNKKKVEWNFYKMDVKHLEKFYEPVFDKLLDVYELWSANLKYDWNKDI